MWDYRLNASLSNCLAIGGASGFCYTPTMSKFAILLDGHLKVTARLEQQLSGARVIAADGGIVHANALKLSPELWIGDFDSKCPPTDGRLFRFQHEGVLGRAGKQGRGLRQYRE